MYAPVSKLAAALGIAVTLGACASIPAEHLSYAQLSQIHPGLAQDEVRAIAGNPPNVTGRSRAGETVWSYPFTDAWGYQSEFDVEFDAAGRVTETSAERGEY